MLQHIHDELRLSLVIVELAPRKTDIAVDAPPIVYVVVVQHLLVLRDEMLLDKLVEFGIVTDVLANLVGAEEREVDKVTSAIVDWLVYREVR